MSLSSKMQTLSSLPVVLLFTQHTWNRMICVMWYRVFNMISVTKGANRRRLCLADLQILLDGWMDTYGINCNYKLYKEKDIISCNSHSGAGMPQSAHTTPRPAGPRLDSRHGQEIFRFSQTLRPALGLTQPPNQFAPCYIHEGKKAGTWCLPLISIYRRGYEWVELYAYSLHTQSWRGQEQHYIYLHFFVRKLCKVGYCSDAVSLNK